MIVAACLAGISIIRDGMITAGPGIAGKGVYAFACSGTDDESLEEVWNRGRAGKCSIGLAFCTRSLSQAQPRPARQSRSSIFRQGGGRC
jgi:hypothetical protein